MKYKTTCLLFSLFLITACQAEFSPDQADLASDQSEIALVTPTAIVEQPADQTTPTADAPISGETDPEANIEILDQAGSTTVYKYNQDMCLASADDSSRLLASDDSETLISRASLSGDQETVAFFRVESSEQLLGELWLVNADGANSRLLTSSEEFNMLSIFEIGPGEGIVPDSLQWLKGDRQLAFGTWNCCYGAIKNDDLHFLDIETGEISTILGQNEAGKLFVSPNRDLIAIANPKSIGFINADGRDLRPNLLQIEEIQTDSEFRIYPLLEWLSDSSGVYVGVISEGEYPIRLVDLWHLPIDGSATFISTLEYTTPVPDLLAPDMAHFAYLVAANGDTIIHVRSTIGDFDEVVGVGELAFFSWISNSEYFFVLKGDEQGTLGEIGGKLREVDSMPSPQDLSLPACRD